MNKSEIISKYSKKFVAGPKSGRPILQGVHYAASGDVFATNGHIGLRIKGAHSFKEPATMLPSGGALEGVYPDLGRVYPVDSKIEISISRSDLSDIALKFAAARDVAARLNKKLPFLSICLTENGSAELKITDSRLEFSATLSASSGYRSNLELLFNADYMLLATALIADVNAEQTLICINGMRSPVVFKAEDYEVIIMPYNTKN